MKRSVFIISIILNVLFVFLLLYLVLSNNKIYSRKEVYNISLADWMQDVKIKGICFQRTKKRLVPELIIYFEMNVRDIMEIYRKISKYFSDMGYELEEEHRRDKGSIIVLEYSKGERNVCVCFPRKINRNRKNKIEYKRLRT